MVKLKFPWLSFSKSNISILCPGSTFEFVRTFCEHTWDIHRVSDNYKNSRINIRFPDKSRGLSEDDVQDLLKKTGPNLLPKHKEVNECKLYIKQFLNMLWIVLTIAALFTLISFFANTSDTTGLWVSVILFAMIFIMCTISWYQEREARKVIQGFHNLMPDKCTVIRDGMNKIIYTNNLVVGDILKIQNGDRIPADARILQCSQLRLEASAITGEAEPIEYYEKESPENINIFDAKNVAFNSSLCVDGEGVGIVIRTGINTVIGQISELITGQPSKKSHLDAQIKKFFIFLLIAALIIGTVVFVIGGTIHNWKNIAMLLATSYAICAVAMFPEGLPVTLTSIMMVIAKRMEKKNVYLKRMDVVETLGYAGIVATDKTGTLTKNLMTVTNLWYYDEVVTGTYPFSESNIGVKPLDSFLSPLADILLAMTVCNKATSIVAKKIPELDQDPNKGPKGRGPSVRFKTAYSFNLTGTYQRTILKKNFPFIGFKNPMAHPSLGSPSDIAMLIYASKMIDVKHVRRKHPIIFEIPFNSKRKWQLIIIKIYENDDDTAKYKLIMKGAPEILIEKCDRIILSSENETGITEEILENFRKSYEAFGEQGCRVFGFVQTEFTAFSGLEFSEKEENFPTTGLTFVGTCALMDPPRDETMEAVKKCKEAGIKVFMLTGDHHTTAKAVAKQIGLINSSYHKDWAHVYGEEIEDLSESEWDSLISKNSLVFSRTTPEQKLLIVEKCQKRKHIIAMTGDGVNDAPALKKSNIGVGMGSGSEVAKQASDIILTDDNFASIVAAIQEGRLMFDNIKKLMAYVLVHLVPELWAIVIHYCFGMPIGTTSLQILTIDIGTEIPPGVAFCKEPAEGDVMKRPPKREYKSVVCKTLLLYGYFYLTHIQALGCFLAYCCVFWSYNISISDLWMTTTHGHFQEGGTNFTSNGRVFSIDEQIYINKQACSAWQVGIVFGQVFHLFSTRTLRQSIFRHGFFSNKASLIAITIEMFLLLAFVYMPGVNNFIGGAPVPIQCWIVVAAVGVLIFVINEIRKLFIRKWPKNNIVRIFKF